MSKKKYLKKMRWAKQVKDMFPDSHSAKMELDKAIRKSNRRGH